MIRTAAVALTVASLLGCGGAYQGQEQVSRADLGDAWPLTVDEGELRCEGRPGQRSATIVTADGTYALTARAEARHDGEPIGPIWAPIPGAPGRNEDLQPLIDRALELCARAADAAGG